MKTREAQTAAIRSGREIAEAVRSLRSTVKFASGERPIRSVLVVDIDRERPSTVAEQLAAAFVEAGDNAVLIETDSRTSSDASTGLFDLMHDQTVLSTAAPADARGVVRIGPGRAGSPDALASDAFSSVLGRLVDAHGFAILTSAPLPQYADALAIAARVDAVILVVTAGRSRRPKAIEARDALDRVRARMLGVVMVEPEKRWFW